MATRVVVVTGSSSGIGRQTAIEFARSGHAVVLHTRANLSGLQAVAAELLREGAAQVRCISANIQDARACHDLVAAAFAWQGNVDVWVNNAGVDLLTNENRNLDFALKLQKLLDIDVLGTIRLSREVLTRWQNVAIGDSAPGSPSASRAQQPALINMGWDQATLGMEGDPGMLFCTSKAAVMAFTQSLAMTAAPQVRVNCVAPGWIKTAWGESAASPYWETRACGESLQSRWGTPLDVARTIHWLASPEAEFVNGQTIAVNGGRRFYPG